MLSVISLVLIKSNKDIREKTTPFRFINQKRKKHSREEEKGGHNKPIETIRSRTIEA